MKYAWTPIIKEVLLLIFAVLIFLVLYDCLVEKKKFKEAFVERFFMFFFQRGLGWIVYLIAIVAVFYLVYSVFFE